MLYYMENMIKNLSEDDKVFLKAIYAPKVVAVPPADAGMNMCVTPEGEIRIYGNINKTEPDDAGTPVYISSKDCGLSWKTHLIHTSRQLGAAGYNPETGRYIAVYPHIYRGKAHHYLDKKGTWAILNDEGYDSENNREIMLDDGSRRLQVLKKPYYFGEIKRWLIPCEDIRKDGEKFIVVFTSDDDGESWKENTLPHAPRFEVKPPHKSTRWQEYSAEPTIAYLGEGRLMMLVRTSQDYHYVYYSEDNGDTWTDPEQSVFHGTITMPVLQNLSDGRIVLFWCNNQPMPEIDKDIPLPPLTGPEKAGTCEDVFTNRDVNHLAISEDKGKTWTGFRELFLNKIRNNMDFRSVGGLDERDKSVHQAELLELPYNKLMVSFGQNDAARKVVILDLDWLYEKERSENFRYGAENISTHMFVVSNLGNYRGFSGHCAYNRTNGALLVPDPDLNTEEVLQLCRVEDSRIVYKKQGAVWNFPASEKGTVRVKFMIKGSGIAVSLTDHWYNAFDETVKDEAFLSVNMDESVCGRDKWCTLEINYDTEKQEADICIDKKPYKKISSDKKMPNGLCYLHLQTLAEGQDLEGTLIKALEKRL